MIGVIAVDSLKVRIPLKDVSIIESNLFGAKYVIDANTHEVESEFTKNRHTVQSHGITTSYGIESQVTANQKVVDYLVLLFNSKLLGRNYFDGIHSENIREVYDSVMSQGVVSFTYESFLSSSATDVDYKNDLIENNFEEKMKHMVLYAYPSKKINRGVNKFDTKTSQGIEFGKRATATSSYPYLKFYAKTMELIHNSREFYRSFLTEEDLPSIVRCEFTIKNKKHFKKYGIEDTSLISILSLDQNQLKEILISVVNVHLSKRIVKTQKANSRMKPNDVLIFNAINFLMQYAMPYNSIRESLISNIDDKTARFRKRKDLDRIYNEYIKGQDYQVKFEKDQQFYDSIGWG